MLLLEQYLRSHKDVSVSSYLIDKFRLPDPRHFSCDLKILSLKVDKNVLGSYIASCDRLLLQKTDYFGELKY